MTDSSTHSTDPMPPEDGTVRGLAILVHAVDRPAPDAAWCEQVSSLGHRLFSHGVEGIGESIQSSVSEPGAWCGEIGALAPGHDILLLRAPLLPTPEQLRELQECCKGATPRVLSVLSNAVTDLNPFAGLKNSQVTGRSDLVEQLAVRETHSLGAMPWHLALFNHAAVETLAGCLPVPAALASVLRQSGGHLDVAAWLYVHDAEAAPSAEPRLDPFEQERPRAIGDLARRLQLTDQPAPVPDSPRDVTLHITHSWGGGVAQWLASFIEADPDGWHLQLRSEGPQTGGGAGQRLALYAGNDLSTPLQSWWLQPPIEATVERNDQVREVLEQITSRYNVGRVLVSSLVGHSLDVLRSGLPTLQMMHDAYPDWPLLSTNPANFGHDLVAALSDPGVRQEFPGIDAKEWQALGLAHRLAVIEHNVTLAAPSEAAAGMLSALDPDWAEIPVTVIPHGLPPLPDPQPVVSRPRDDGRLRLVIPGRMQDLKGAEILRRALPELTRHAHVTLLGTGKGGEAFFGLPGVNVVLEYERASLPSLLNSIGPHVAALLSVVPETFSYTLSEMQVMGLPVIATQVGSLAERIDHEINGWLIEPRADALVAQVAALAARPELLDAARHALADHVHRTTADMVTDTLALVPAAGFTPTAIEANRLDLDRAQWLSARDELRQASVALAKADQHITALKKESKERASWAEGVKRELAETIRQRKLWVDSLNRELQEKEGQLATAIASLDETRQQRDHLERELGGLNQVHEDLKTHHEQVLASTSWRLTMPLRVARRVLHNFMRSRAWNPLRWPLMISQFVRNLSTVGLRGTLERLQWNAHAEAAPTQELPPLIEPAEVTLPGSVPQASEPTVSVVIPVFNQLHFTAACLRSLADTPCDVPFEIIVVDDASTDDSLELLPTVLGLTVLRNAENLGFIGSCNRGAEAARGEFVFFLNNDTQVTSGWLESLLDVFTTRQDAGLVGSKLVYPDGRLQECGGLVFNDGSGWNLGRGGDPSHPEYQALRETDYCSGAAILLRTQSFRDLGGFDTRYAPAYYEDTDLAFRIRAAGLKVYVQPASTIVHFEGATSGTDLASGAKRHQVTNQATFRDRWADALAQQPSPIGNPDDAQAVRAARDHRLRGRVLVVDAYTPEPDQDSGSVRLTRMMQCLQDLGYGVDFLPDNRAFAGRYTRALQAMGVTCWYAPEAESVNQLFSQYGNAWDLVIVSRHYVAVNYLSAVRKHCPQARFVFDTVDLHYLREQRLAELESSLPLERVARQTRRSELGVVADADATLVVSPVEIEVLAEDAPGASVHLLSNIHQLSPSVTPFEQRKDLFFVGGYQHPPNIDAVTWFVHDIWPLVHAELPEAQFHIVGSKAPDAIRALAGDGVVFHGFAETLEPFLDGCRLAVAPLRYGAGVKGKVNHSMAHGQPVVATPMATEGMHAKPGEDVLVAEDAEGFAREVVRGYQDAELWNRISENGRENVRQHFSLESARGQLRELIASFDTD